MARQISSIVRKDPTKSIIYIAKKFVNLSENEIFEKILKPKSVGSLEKSNQLLKSFKPVVELSGMKFNCKNKSLDRLLCPNTSSGNVVLKARDVVFPMKNLKKNVTNF